jgi:hypothetical protein
MAGIKKRGIVSVQNHRYYKGQRVRPSMWIRSGGRKLLTATIIETNEVVKDEMGNPVPWNAVG